MSTSAALSWSFCRFLEAQISSGAIFGDNVESAEVALQCLQQVYSIEADTAPPAGLDSLDLLAVVAKHLELNREPSEQDKAKAEELKNKGNELHKCDQLEEAVAAYTEAIALYPSNAVFFANRAAAYSKLTQHLKAVEDCRRAVELDPNYHKAYGRMGLAYKAMERWSEAKECFSRALQLDAANEQYRNAFDEVSAAMESTTGPGGMPNMNAVFGNPEFMTSMMSMMQSPDVQNMMGGFITNMQSQGGDIGGLLQMGQQIAAQMQETNPELVERLRTQHQGPEQGPDQPPPADGTS